MLKKFKSHVTEEQESVDIKKNSIKKAKFIVFALNNIKFNIGN